MPLSMKFIELPNPPHGVPIFLETAEFNQVSIRLIVFVGSADDEVGGGLGIYHWFEHVPFRGTTLFPNGYEDTMGQLERHGGSVNASTGITNTVFQVVLPRSHWLTGFRLVVDLASRPLLTDEAIEAERKVIHNEISSRTSGLGGYAWYELYQHHLWRGHPYGHHALGTQKSLDEITLATLREAKSRGYDRSRMAVVISGNLPVDEVRREAEEIFKVLPVHGLSERRAPASYGPVPAWEPGRVELETTFNSSLVSMMWPIPQITTENRGRRESLWLKVSDLFNAGSLASPIMQITRGDNHLVYGAGASVTLLPDVGLFCLTANTHRDPELVENLFRQVLTDKRVTSPERYQYVNDHLRGQMEMTILDPHAHTRLLAATLVGSGQAILTHDEIFSRDLAITHAELLSTLATLTPERAKTFIFRGKKK